jgi:hypothetical protein
LRLNFRGSLNKGKNTASDKNDGGKDNDN